MNALLIGLEAAWWSTVLGVLAAISADAAPWEGWLPAALLMAAAYLASHLVQRRIDSDRAGRLIFLAVAAVTVPLAAGLQLGPSMNPGEAWWAAVSRLRLDAAGPAGAVQLLLLVMVWVRGGNLARRPPRLSQAVDSFQIGLLVVLAAGLAGLTTARPVSLGLVLALFGFGLPAMALARASERAAHGQSRLFGAWLVSVLGTLLIVFLFGLAVTAVATTDAAVDLIDAVGRAGSALFLFLFVPLEYVLGSIALLVYALFRWLLERLGPPRQLPQQPQEPASWDFLSHLNNASAGISPPIAQAIGWILGVIVVAAALAIAYRVIAAREGRAASAHEQRDRVGGLATLAADLAGLVAGKARGLARRDEARPPPLHAQMTVRELYRAVLLRLRSEGVERAAAQSPLDLQPVLASRFLPAAVDDLTQAYLAERYGCQPPDDEARQALIAQWRRLLAANSNGPGRSR